MVMNDAIKLAIETVRFERDKLSDAIEVLMTLQAEPEAVGEGTETVRPAPAKPRGRASTKQGRKSPWPEATEQEISTVGDWFRARYDTGDRTAYPVGKVTAETNISHRRVQNACETLVSRGWLEGDGEGYRFNATLNAQADGAADDLAVDAPNQA